jgi:hypothetical protein
MEMSMLAFKPFRVEFDFGVVNVNYILHQSAWPPLWSTGQSSGYRSRGPGIDSQCYQIFWEVVGLERGPFSLVSTIEEPLGRNDSGSGL